MIRIARQPPGERNIQLFQMLSSYRHYLSQVIFLELKVPTTASVGDWLRYVPSVQASRCGRASEAVATTPFTGIGGPVLEKNAAVEPNQRPHNSSSAPRKAVKEVATLRPLAPFTCFDPAGSVKWRR